MDLSVLIPARNEMFLRRTVEDVLAHAKADTEVIVILDGAWPDPPLEKHERVTVVYHPESVGQRAATNEAARLSQARFVMKLDAHCSVADGFDVALIEAAKELGEDVTQVPAQKNLHVFDWVCSEAKHKACDFRQYQGPTPTVEVDGKRVPGCPKCGGEVEREMVWKPRRGVTTTTWRFDRDLHFQYWGDYSRRPEAQGTDFPETMSCLGACFFMSRARYWALGGMDEAHGSWGNMGTEVGCKSWLSGGRMVTNRRTWFAHMFRTQGGDFGFPYPLSGKEVDRARKHSRSLWMGNKWPGQVRPLSWLVEHFAPVPGWEVEDAVPAGSRGQLGDTPSGPAALVGPPSQQSEEGRTRPVSAPTKGIVYYSDCRGDEKILSACRRQLKRAANGHRIVAATLAPVCCLGSNIVLAKYERGYLTMFRQILAGLEALDADVAFLAEHDVLYHPSHFDFIPPDRGKVYYNVNVWKVDASTGRALHYDCKQTSGLCAYRDILLAHYRERVRRVEVEGFSRRMGFEPGTHGRAERVDDLKSEAWVSFGPNVDIRHGFNLTESRWSQEQFRDKRNCRGWIEAAEVPGWGVTRGRFAEWLGGL